MCAESGTKVLLMNEATSSSSYDSASSRTHAPHAGAALKSTSKGFLLFLASASAASASFNHWTFIFCLLFSGYTIEMLFIHQRITFGAMDGAVAVLWWTVKGVEFQLLSV